MNANNPNLQKPKMRPAPQKNESEDDVTAKVIAVGASVVGGAAVSSAATYAIEENNDHIDAGTAEVIEATADAVHDTVQEAVNIAAEHNQPEPEVQIVHTYSQVHHYDEPTFTTVIEDPEDGSFIMQDEDMDFFNDTAEGITNDSSCDYINDADISDFTA